MEWIDGLAEALGGEPLPAEDTARLLSTARQVAHRVERRLTPVAAFLLGEAVGRATAGGAERRAAFSAALDALGDLLPDEQSEP